MEKQTQRGQRNKQRSAAKALRGKGQLAMQSAGMNESQWAQKHDPLFQVKGIKRHLIILERRNAV